MGRNAAIDMTADQHALILDTIIGGFFYWDM